MWLMRNWWDTLKDQCFFDCWKHTLWLRGMPAFVIATGVAKVQDSGDIACAAGVASVTR